jgi:multicomponent Na+:H+ antiporter subunit B
MNSIILKTTTNFVLALLLMFSAFVLLRGHYYPGGGFVGGLIAAIAFVLHSFAYGLKSTRQLLRIHPGFLMPLGFLIAVLSAVAPIVLQDLPFMTALWFENKLPVIGLVGSALFFDIGVYFVVIGASLSIIFTVTETT